MSFSWFCYPRYEIDETSPSIYDAYNQDDYDYEIMSKAIGQKKEKAVSKEEEANKAAMKMALEALG